MPLCRDCIGEKYSPLATPGSRLEPGEQCDRCGATRDGDGTESAADGGTGVADEADVDPRATFADTVTMEATEDFEEGFPWASDPGEVRTSFGDGELVAVDFDGTLTQGEARYWEDEVEQPREPVVDWVRQQYYNGASVVVWTARPWSEAATIAARLTEWGVPHHGIRCEKGGADGYLEDKAVRPSEVLD